MGPRYRLPSGQQTIDIIYCVAAWRELARPIAESLDAHLVAFDSGITLQENCEAGQETHLDTWVAQKLYKSLTGKAYKDPT